MVRKRMIHTLRTTKWESYNHNPFDFGKRLGFDAATVTKTKISPGTQNIILLMSLTEHRKDGAIDLCSLDNNSSL